MILMELDFKTADDLALKIGVDQHDHHRIQAAIVYAFKRSLFSRWKYIS